MIRLRLANDIYGMPMANETEPGFAILLGLAVHSANIQKGSAAEQG